MEQELNSNIKAKVDDSKNFSLDTFHVNYYVDIQDDNRNWKVGKIIDRNKDILTVHYEGFQNKNDEKISYTKTDKVTYFRKFTKGYTGPPKQAYGNSSFNPDDCQEIRGIMKNLVEAKFQMEPAALTQALRGRIFFFLDMMMTCPVKEPQKIGIMMETIFDYISFIVEYLKFYKENCDVVHILCKNKDLFLVDSNFATLAALEEIILCVRRILGHDARVSEFYKTHEESIRKYYKEINMNNFKNKLCIEKAYRNGVTVEYNNLKIPANIIAYVIDYMNDKQLFNMCMDILCSDKQGSNAMFPFEVIDLLLKPFSFIQLLTGEFMNPCFNFSTKGLMKDYLYSRIQNLNEAEIKEIKKSSVVGFLNYMTTLTDFKSLSKRSVFEELYLLYYLKCLTNKSFERKIFAMNSFSLIIDTIEYKEIIVPKQKCEIDPEIELTDAKAFINFIMQHNLIKEVILGDNIHDEILKRSLPWFKLLARKQCLNTEVYDLLWKNYIEKHESISIQIENIISELAYYISDKDKLYIYAKIKSYAESLNNLPNPVRVINFIKQFTEYCFRRLPHSISFPPNIDIYNEERMYGLPLLWSNMQDSTNVENSANTMLNDDIRLQTEIIEASSTAVKSLMDVIDDTIRERIIELCFLNLKHNTSIVQSLELAKKIILDWFKGVKGRRVVKKLDDSLNLIEMIVNDLDRYMRKNATLSAASTPMKTIIEGFYDLKTNITSRLEMIYFLTTPQEGRINLQVHHVDRVWQLLTTNGSEIAELLYENLIENLSEFDQANLEYLFHLISQRNEHQGLTLKFFQLFQNIFFEVNTNRRHLIQDVKIYRVQSETILGLEALWEMLISVKDQSILNQISDLLCDLCTDIKIYTEDFCLNYWISFIAKLNSLLEETYNASNATGVKNILVLIKKIFSLSNVNGELPKQDDVNWPKEGLEYTFICPDRNDQKYTIRVSSNELVYDVRWRAAYFFDIPVNIVKLKNGKRLVEMNNDFENFKSLFPYGSIIEVREGIHPIFNLKNNPRSLIMNNTQMAKILYELLHHENAEFVQDAWELISLLPKLIKVEEEINQIAQVNNISSIFDEKSIYITSYSLKIIKSLLTESQEWIKNFSQGGYEAVLNLFFKIKLEHFSKYSLGFEYLNDLLMIIKGLLSIQPKSHEEIGMKTIQILGMIIESSINKKEDPELKSKQEKYKKLRDKEINSQSKSSSNDESSSDEEGNIQGEEFCEEYRTVFNMENDSVRNLVDFLTMVANDNVVNILEESNFISHFTRCLIFSLNYKLKETLLIFLDDLLKRKSHLAEKYTSNIFKHLLHNSTLEIANSHTTSSFYFKALATLVHNHLDSSGVNKELIEFIAKFILTTQDEILEGYLAVLKVLIEKSPCSSFEVVKSYNLLDVLLNTCLLAKCNPVPLGQSYPKCNTPSAIENGFKVLSALAFNNQSVMTKIISTLSQYHVLNFWKSKKLLDWKFSLTNDNKTTHVGIKNLGCTCYMNCLFQQIFIIQGLREAILASPDTCQSGSLFELKNILACLKAYESQYYNAKDFCLNFDGIELNIREQMDADEFFNTMIDKVENHLKETPMKNVFKHFFGGTISDELLFKDCPHNREKEVFFTTIQLQVLNKKSILESLKSYVGGETMEGDNAINCESCDKKMSAVLRQSFKRLPRILIVVMKRFEFDYDNMIKIKVNDYCEFPMELDMTPYTHSSRNVSPLMNKYSLSGVVIHTGTSETGHYYSIIKDKDNWYEFNDTNVTPYDINDLSDEAFGGTETVYRDNKKTTVEKSTNAYILFYSKVNTEDIDSNEYPCNIPTQWDNFSNISPTVMDRINQDMFYYWVSKMLFSQPYQNFILELVLNSLQDFDRHPKRNDNLVLFPRNYYNDEVNRFIVFSNITRDMCISTKKSDANSCCNVIKPEYEIELFKFLSCFFFNILIRSKEKQSSSKFIDVMKFITNKNVESSQWLLEEFSNLEVLSDFLMECPIIELRKIVTGIIYSAMIKIFKSDPMLSLCLKQFIGNVIFIIISNKETKDKDLTYLQAIVHRFTMLGDTCRKYLIDIGMFNYLTFYYLSKYDSSTALSEAYHKSKNDVKVEMTKPEHSHLNEKRMQKVDRPSSIEMLIEKKHQEKMLSSRHDCYLLMAYCELLKVIPTDMNKYVNYGDFFYVNSLISEVKSKASAVAVAKLMSKVCHNNIENTNTFQAVILSAINTMDSYELEYVMIILRSFLLKIDDSLKDSRIKSILQKHFHILNENMKYYAFVDFNVDFFVNLFENNYDILKGYIDLVKEGIMKLIKFLKDNPVPPKLFPSKTLTMHKKIQTNFPNKVNQLTIKNFEERYNNISKEKRERLGEIWKKTVVKKKTFDYDLDLTDFKFVLQDKVQYDGINGVVIGVLDEMINIEYNKKEIQGKKKPLTQWVDTDSKELYLVEMYEEDTMEVEKK